MMPIWRNALCQFFESFFVKLSTRLVGVSFDAVDVYLVNARRTASAHFSSGDEGIESAPQIGIFLLYSHAIRGRLGVKPVTSHREMQKV